MKFKKKFVALALSSLVLGGCLSDDNAVPATNVDSYVLTTSNALVGVDSSNGRTGDALAITGLQASENLFDIDFRNADGRMWALSNLGNLYTIDLETGAATPQSTLTGVTLNAMETYSIDFNPTVDRLRILGTDDMSYATNVENGVTATNGALNIAGTAAGGVVVDAAYTDTFSTTTGRGTALFSIDAQNGVLYSQNVGTGALTQVASLGVTGLQDIQGYDIDPESQQGLAVFQVNGQAALYRVSTNSAATLIDELELNGATAIGFAAVTSPNPTVVGLNAANGIFTFRAAQPDVTSAINTPSGISAGESLIGIDYSTAANQFYLIGRIEGMTPSSSLYSMPAAGVATAPALTRIAALTNAGMTEPLAVGVTYSIDINPTNGGLRLVGSDDSNAAVAVATGVVTRGVANGTLNPTTVDLAAHAYTNSISGAVVPTELRAVDTVSGNLVKQNFMATDANVTDLAIDLGTNVVRPAAFDIRYSSDLGLLGLKDQAVTQTTLYTLIDDQVTEVGPIGGASGPTNVVDFSITQ